MTTFSYGSARSAIMQVFSTAWTPTGNKVLYEDVEDPNWVKPNLDEAWAQIQVRHTDVGRSLSGGDGKASYSREGTVIVQVFTPTGNGLQLADSLCSIVSNAFVLDRSSGIFFRNSRTREIGRDGGWFQTNILTDFQYTEVK